MSFTSDNPAMRRRWGMIVWALVLAGTICRVAQYLSRRSYWHDEAYLVLNIFSKTLSQLTGPLDIREQAPQAAPPLFLAIQRGLYLLWGASEYVMRVQPLILGIAALALMALIAWRLLQPWAAAFAVALFAFSDRLIWHASEAKQYSGDVFVALLLLLIALVWPQKWSAIRRLFVAGVLASLAMWLSHPAVFVFGGTSLALLPQVAGENGRWKLRATLKYLAANVLPVVSFALLYVLSIRVQQAPRLFEYWSDRFLSPARPDKFLALLYQLADYPLENGGGLILLLGIAGAVAWAKEGRRLSVLVWPIALLILAALLHKYPFGGHRLTLFLAPTLFLLAAAGAQHLYQRFWAPAANWSLALPGALLVMGTISAAHGLAVPRTRDHIRPAVQYLAAHYQMGEGIYALRREEFLCYWAGSLAEVRFEIGPGDQVPFERFWIITSVSRSKGLRDSQGQLQQAQSVAREQPLPGAPPGLFLFQKEMRQQ